MGERPVRIGILGAGGIAERAMVVPSHEVDGTRVVAIGARDPERAHAFAERLAIAKSGDYEAVLSDPDIDLVYLALPPIVHAEWAVARWRRASTSSARSLCPSTGPPPPRSPTPRLRTAVARSSASTTVCTASPCGCST